MDLYFLLNIHTFQDTKNALSYYRTPTVPSVGILPRTMSYWRVDHSSSPCTPPTCPPGWAPCGGNPEWNARITVGMNYRLFASWFVLLLEGTGTAYGRHDLSIFLKKCFFRCTVQSPKVGACTDQIFDPLLVIAWCLVPTRIISLVFSLIREKQIRWRWIFKKIVYFHLYKNLAFLISQ